ncbi:hypothetical protein HXX76_016282, partial [Chlamydomonas incerta]
MEAQVIIGVATQMLKRDQHVPEHLATKDSNGGNLGYSAALVCTPLRAWACPTPASDAMRLLTGFEPGTDPAWSSPVASQITWRPEVPGCFPRAGLGGRVYYVGLDLDTAPWTAEVGAAAAGDHYEAASGPLPPNLVYASPAAIRAVSAGRLAGGRPCALSSNANGNSSAGASPSYYYLPVGRKPPPTTTPARWWCRAAAPAAWWVATVSISLLDDIGVPAAMSTAMLCGVGHTWQLVSRSKPVCASEPKGMVYPAESQPSLAVDGLYNNTRNGITSMCALSDLAAAPYIMIDLGAHMVVERVEVTKSISAAHSHELSGFSIAVTVENPCVSPE